MTHYFLISLILHKISCLSIYFISILLAVDQVNYLIVVKLIIYYSTPINFRLDFDLIIIRD